MSSLWMRKRFLRGDLSRGLGRWFKVVKSPKRMMLSRHWKKVITAGPEGRLISITLENPGPESLFNWVTYWPCMIPLHIRL